jgi:hypothetical protein
MFLPDRDGNNPPPLECPLRGNPVKPDPETSYAGMKFLSAAQSEAGGIEANYKGEHHTPGRDGTVFVFDVAMTIRSTGTKISVDLGYVEKLTTFEAMEKMAEWLQRASLALKNAKQSKEIPLFLPDK